MKQQDYSLWLANGTVLLVANDLPTEQRQAALDTLIYAQLLANKKQGPRLTHFPKWHEAYVQAISMTGWIITQRSNEHATGKNDAPLSLTQPLQEWLHGRNPAAVPALNYALATIAHGSAECLRSLTHQTHAHGSCALLEVGVVQTGPVIDLCCVFVDCSVPLEQVGLGYMMAGDTLREYWMKGFCATLDPASFEKHQARLHETIAEKQAEFRYLVPLDELNTGGGRE